MGLKILLNISGGTEDYFRVLGYQKWKAVCLLGWEFRTESKTQVSLRLNMEPRTTQQTLSDGEVAAQCAELVASLHLCWHDNEPQTAPYDWAIKWVSVHEKQIIRIWLMISNRNTWHFCYYTDLHEHIRLILYNFMRTFKHFLSESLTVTFYPCSKTALHHPH